MDHLETDICVIGGGSGGLSVAAGASQLGADTVLIERNKMGGDCLNYGCVPSKAFIAASRAAHNFDFAKQFGITSSNLQIDFNKVNRHVHDVIEEISHHDSVERFEGLGVNVIQEEAKFISPDEVQAGKQIIKAKYFVIATGSSPSIPPIPGLSQTDFHTNETIFSNKTLPKHLIVIGGGPIGVELAQAHRRLGSEVTIIEMFSILGRDDPEIVTILKDKFKKDGINIEESARIENISGTDGNIKVEISRNDKKTTISGSHLLVAAGRLPNIDSLDLHKADILGNNAGIIVDKHLRTTNKKVFAIGDVINKGQFTHAASFHASVVIRNTLFKFFPTRYDKTSIPWVTYTDPEVAHVGMTEPILKQSNRVNFDILRWTFDENDRAHTEKQTEGLIKITVSKSGKILGANIIGPHAGELILPWVLGVNKGMNIKDFASLVAPYPTFSEANKRVATTFFASKLFSDTTKKIVRLVLDYLS